MEFKIKNIGKIADSKFDLKGITVFVGDNNTGKTTVGKCLYAFFASFYQIDDKVQQYRRERVGSLLFNFIFEYARGIDEDVLKNVAKFARMVLDGEDSDSALGDIRAWLSQTLSGKASDSEIDAFCKKLSTVRGISVAELKRANIQRLFNAVFSKQYLRIADAVVSGEISAVINERTVTLHFENDECSYTSEKAINQPVYLVQNSTPLSLLGKASQELDFDDSPIHSTFLQKVEPDKKEDKNNPTAGSVSNDIFDEIEFKDSYKRLSGFVPGIIQGNFGFNRENDLEFNENGILEPIKIDNVSEGLKQFGMLGLMISRRVFRPGDILILDEPEVHLHPTWLLKYAELVVLLQREFKLHVVISTHSADFVDALRLYAKKHGSEEFLNAYIASLKAPNEAQFECVEVKDWDRVFNGFVKTLDLLYNLRKELGE